MSCSTPEGIRGMGTSKNKNENKDKVVLNARRHQRDGHINRGFLRLEYMVSAQRPKASEGWALLVDRAVDFPGHVCSTPEGIRGMGTARVLLFLVVPLCAQRPKASRDGHNPARVARANSHGA